MTVQAGRGKPRRRRGLRIVLRVPLIISMVDGASRTEWESAETVTVSRHGAMIRMEHEFQVGSTLEIRMRSKDRTARARVAWISTKTTPQAVEMGFEILDQEGFWEFNFPADRWSDQADSETSEP